MKKAFIVAMFTFISVFSNIHAQSKAGDPMILEFNTALSDGTTIDLIIKGSNLNIDWGDGDTEFIGSTADPVSHTYSTNDTYTVIIEGNLDAFGGDDVNSNMQKLTKILSFGELGTTSFCEALIGANNLTEVPSSIPSSVTSMSYMFSGNSSFNYNINIWDVSNVTEMNGMFSGSSFNQDLNNWNVGNVTDMDSMFCMAWEFKGNLSSWDVSKVTSMNSMFLGASVFNSDISNWNVGNVTDMNEMFWYAEEFNSDIGNWNVGSVTNMELMFANATSFNQDLNNWNVSNVEYMNIMFWYATSFNGNVGDWDVSNVTRMDNMFEHATSFNQDISNWNVSNVTDMNSMFMEAFEFNSNISNWNVSNVTNMYCMFYSAEAFNGNIGNWDVSNVTNMKYMFTGDSISANNYDNILNSWSNLNLQSNIEIAMGSSRYSPTASTARQKLIDSYNWTITDGGLYEVPTPEPPTTQPMILEFNTSLTKGTSVGLPLFGSIDVTVDWGDGTTPEVFKSEGKKYHTYATDGVYTVTITGTLPVYGGAYHRDINAEKLVKVKSFGDVGLEQLSFAFYNATNLIEVPSTLPSSIHNLAFTFCQANSFNGDLSGWEVSNVSNTKMMFQGATSFNSDISSWNVSKVSDFTCMFNGASSFNQDIGNWNLSKATNTSGMFSRATVFNQDLSKWDVGNVTNMDSMFYKAISFNSNIGTWNVSSITRMIGMFEQATSFNSDISKWNVANAYEMSKAFKNAQSFDRDLSAWDIGNVKYMNEMFKGITLSVENYDALLIGWSKLSLEGNVKFDAGNSQYSWEAVDAIRILVQEWAWTITDGGLSGPANPDPMVLEFNTSLTKGTTINLMANGNNLEIDWGDGTNESVASTSDPVPHTYATDGIYQVSISGDLDAYGGWKNNDGVEKLTKVVNFGDLGITSLNFAFSGATNLTEVPSTVPTSVTSMRQMFQRATKFNGYIGDWDVSNVKDMYSMFSGAKSFNQKINGWDVSKVSNMACMFAEATSFNQDIYFWNVSNVTKMDSMFIWATSFSRNLNSWNVSNVTSMVGMFWDAKQFNGNISYWDVSKVTDMSYMFQGDSLSVEMYDALLIEWSKHDLQKNVFFDAGKSINSNSSATAKQKLITRFNWNITDGVELPANSIDTIIACDSITWIDGKLYTINNNSARHTLTDVSGNDSIVSLDLTINYSNSNMQLITACDSLLWIDGKTYYESTDTTIFHLTNSVGCDSAVRLDATINKTNYVIDSIISCSEYKWIDGITYSENNSTATHVLQNTFGCDSIVSLHLTILDADDIFTFVDTITNADCHGSATGSINLTTKGGLEPYLYSWSNGSKKQHQNDLEAGTYTVTVQDADGCATTKDFKVIQPDTLLSFTAETNNILCKGKNTGSIILDVVGGTKPYTYSWSNGSTNKDQLKAKAKNYWVIVSDSNGCNKFSRFTITEPESILSASGKTVMADCDINNSGSINLEVSGGTKPYFYVWSNGSSNKNQSDLRPGNYEVTISDTNDCTYAWQTSIIQKAKGKLSGVAQNSNGSLNANSASIALFKTDNNEANLASEINIGDSGTFAFNKLSSGEYLVCIDPEESQESLLKTYYRQAFKWQNAQTINVGCDDSIPVIVDMLEVQPGSNGTASISGIITESNGRLKSTNATLSDITVLLINEFSDSPEALTTTNESGYYEFSNVAPGMYSIYIDITGIDHKTTYSLNVDYQNTNFIDLDFEIDLLNDREINSTNRTTLTSHTVNKLENLKVYPNPAYKQLTLKADCIKGNNVVITLYSNAGHLVKTEEFKAINNQSDVIQINLSNIENGTYIVKLESANKTEYKTFIKN